MAGVEVIRTFPNEAAELWCLATLQTDVAHRCRAMALSDVSERCRAMVPFGVADRCCLPMPSDGAVRRYRSDWSATRVRAVFGVFFADKGQRYALSIEFTGAVPCDVAERCSLATLPSDVAD
jgi:hypothetical protein